MTDNLKTFVLSIRIDHSLLASLQVRGGERGASAAARDLLYEAAGHVQPEFRPGRDKKKGGKVLPT